MTWKGESQRHSLASRGIKTGQKIPVMRKQTPIKLIEKDEFDIRVGNKFMRIVWDDEIEFDEDSDEEGYWKVQMGEIGKDGSIMVTETDGESGDRAFTEKVFMEWKNKDTNKNGIPDVLE